MYIDISFLIIEVIVILALRVLGILGKGILVTLWLQFV